jgi:hypothetical protein
MNAMASTASPEHDNIAIGVDAMGSVHGGDNATADRVIDNIAIGHEALKGASLVSSGAVYISGNIAIGHEAMNATATNSQTGTIALGKSALTALTTGQANIAIGYNAGDVITTGSQNVFLGYEADADAAADSGHVRIGYYGIMKYYANRVNCTLGGDTENDPAHATPIGKIPQYAVITRATAVVERLSTENNHTLKLVLSSDATGVHGTPLNNVQELIGADATFSWSATGAAGAAADIKVDDTSNGAVLKTAYVAIPYDPAGVTDSGLATLDTVSADTYVYLAFADAAHEGGDTNPSPTIPRVDVMIEYAGLD